MEGIPEKDMEERRRVLEQKNQGINTKIHSYTVFLWTILESDFANPIFRDSEEKAEPG